MMAAFAATVIFSLNSCSSGGKGKGGGFCKDLNEIISIAEKKGTGSLKVSEQSSGSGLGASWESKASVYGMRGKIYDNLLNEGAHYVSYKIIDKASEKTADATFEEYRTKLLSCLGTEYYENVGDDDMGKVRWYYINGEDILNTTHAYISLSESKWGENDNEVFLYVYDPAKD